MTLISSESSIAFTLPCEVPQELFDAFGAYDYESIKHQDGNTIITFHDAGRKEIYLRRLEDFLVGMCNKFPDENLYKRLRLNVKFLITVSNLTFF
jgi:hypothetical protein